MRPFSTILVSISGLALAALAVPGRGNADLGNSCLNNSDAQTLANNFGWLISSWTLNTSYSQSLANVSIATQIHDYSDSIRDLESRGCAVGPQPLDNSSAAFDADQLKVPPFPLRILNLWHSCDVITFRWVSAQTPDRVVGIVVLETVLAPTGRRMISAVYSEFNTAAWFVNIGVFKPSNCTSSKSKLLRA
ncbi:hypothetical protein BDR22DRAFT_885015 [Usnea florida]